jgi:hypothetical protein
MDGIRLAQGVAVLQPVSDWQFDGDEGGLTLGRREGGRGRAKTFDNA